MTVKPLLMTIITALSLSVMPLEAGENKKLRPLTNYEKVTPEYLHDYSPAELKTTPRNSFNGRDNPESFSEDEIWRYFYRLIASFNDDLEEAWYHFQKKMPLFSRYQMEELISFAEDVLDRKRLLNGTLEPNFIELCTKVIDASEANKKRTNQQGQKRINIIKCKVPNFYKQVQEDLKKEFPPEHIQQIKAYIDKRIVPAMTSAHRNTLAVAKGKSILTTEKS
ncbi:MAG: hypothetical protein MJK04_35150 [Psychrosphaera sp.]|nr:hypothetical protein [Psychrosphaera sp.]